MKIAKVLTGLFLFIFCLAIIALPHLYMSPEHFDAALVINAITFIVYTTTLASVIVEIEQYADNVYVHPRIKSLCHVYVFLWMTIFFLMLAGLFLYFMKDIAIQIGIWFGFALIMGLIIAFCVFSVYILFERKD